MTTHEFRCGDCLELLKAMPDNHVDLVFTSPPYPEKGERYGDRSGKLSSRDYVAWMSRVVPELCRVTHGFVCVVHNGAVRGSYLPAIEQLVSEIHEEYPDIMTERPVIWHKNSAPNRKDWFSNNWEFISVWIRKGARRHFDWKAIAEPPKYKSGGKFRQRGKNGERREGGEYPQNPLARPGDVIRCTVGGGHLGHPLAHENEAPFPLKLAERFILSCCPPGGTVLDPFAGSGTVAHAAKIHGRNSIGFDIRQSQLDICERRLADIA